MSAAVLDHPAPVVPGGPDPESTAPGDLELDLRGLDFDTRRRRLFAALRALRPAEQLTLTSGGPDDLHWLRYEMEARIERRYCWTLTGDSSDPAVHTIVHLCPSRSATPAH